MARLKAGLGERKLLITFINNRGAMGHENFFPDLHVMITQAPTFEAAAWKVSSIGFMREWPDHPDIPPAFITPAAILKIEEGKD